MEPVSLRHRAPLLRSQVLYLFVTQVDVFRGELIDPGGAGPSTDG